MIAANHAKALATRGLRHLVSRNWKLADAGPRSGCGARIVKSQMQVGANRGASIPGRC